MGHVVLESVVPTGLNLIFFLSFPGFLCFDHLWFHYSRNHAELCIRLPTWCVTSVSCYLCRCPWRIRHPAKQLEEKQEKE